MTTEESHILKWTLYQNKHNKRQNNMTGPNKKSSSDETLALAQLECTERGQ